MNNVVGQLLRTRTHAQLYRPSSTVLRKTPRAKLRVFPHLFILGCRIFLVLSLTPVAQYIRRLAAAREDVQKQPVTGSNKSPP